jgi:hypothetical protein
MAEEFERHIPLPHETHAFVCALCGAVSLSPEGVCQVQGRITRGDWCGTQSVEPARVCQNKIHNLRFKCQKCGRVAVDAGLLCEPERMPEPDQT